MHSCRYCDRSFNKPESKGAHEKWCNPLTRPDLSGERNPMHGKKGANQWSGVALSTRSWETLSFGKKRLVLLQEVGFACASCGFDKTRSDGTCILQIDHLDGDHGNNAKSNLKVLCPNCHAVESTKFMHIGQKHSVEARAKISASLVSIAQQDRAPLS